MADNNRWGDINRHLKSKGYDVYSPGQHEGECTKRYIVLKMSSMTRINTISSGRFLYDLMLYIPKNEYSQFEDFVVGVEQAMKDLEPMIMPMHYRTPSYYDDLVKGHMISIQYRNNRKF